MSEVNPAARGAGGSLVTFHWPASAERGAAAGTHEPGPGAGSRAGAPGFPWAAPAPGPPAPGAPPAGLPTTQPRGRKNQPTTPVRQQPSTATAATPAMAKGNQ